ncbi:leu operon leader peptide [Salmonella enterica subsp. enterica serovar Brandenburg]|nr:leu operon leader peptide [Salmonella enterica subsp. enterica serovar Brandenburg]
MSHIVRFTGLLLLLLNAFIVHGRPVGGIQH